MMTMMMDVNGSRSRPKSTGLVNQSINQSINQAGLLH